ncbi:hypothetical protein BV360_04630 [Pseudomonas syringae pv. actinidiae]|uniref:Allophanate hydrolase subunit 1 n=1 Tax=Pseudomonas syringae pv. actinidiae TaxID=103796 RepID=A0AAN4TM01_PSESF|nr:hypothetical protein BV340_04434 [Pseudomonas syringae pv. actinidiae]OSN20275.1 hypothetical protein BV341_04555 [Pseudomonas syringae pv. actinidiae]OSN31444.1 hypothetical protein BV342_04558 [Pseudomonas syringae pv. actinidiae]OSN56149.1 hypothetical protein BV347_04616 [Pseudomonas syringae pv. actinidiae]OSN66691.1 hypothetical protein BV350_04630 [Pseudomonas syringae pv. actinidiae]
MADSIRYSFGADEHLFAEVSDSMSLEAFFKGLAVTRAVERLALDGVLDVCLANASFQIRFDPDRIAPHALLDAVREAEAGAVAERTLQTRIIEIPVLYNDPWTHETLMRFRDRHQDPGSTDLEYAARINNLADVDAFIAAHSGAPWFVSMVGFVAGLPGCRSCSRWSSASGSCKCPNTCARVPIRQSLRWVMAGASVASTRCAGRVVTKCSASPRPRSTTRSRGWLT